MGRVFFNTRLNFHKITADYQVLASDSGKTFLVHPAATTAITLPTLSMLVKVFTVKSLLLKILMVLTVVWDKS